MEPNRAIYGRDGEVADVIVGDFFICDCIGENFGSLSEDQQKHYSEMFRDPEIFINLNGKITAVPFRGNESQDLER